MSNHATSTPAAKRFLASQNASSSKSHTSSSSARRSQFLRPTQTLSSSPHTVTQLSRRSRQADEIETSFEDDDESNPVHNSRARPRIATDLGHDNLTIDEDDYGVGISVSSDQFSSPLPKRQKRAHHIENNRDSVSASSPISLPESPTDGEAARIDGPLDHDGSGADDMDVEIVEPPPTISKFLAPTHARFPPPEAGAKPAFRSLPSNALTGNVTQADTVLPHAFSPSRRRGRRDYMKGGLADTVRNLVLQMASNGAQSSEHKDRLLNVKYVTTDERDRFDVVQDEKSNVWMLTRSDERSGTILKDAIDAHGCLKILVRGHATNWSINSYGKDRIFVAVLWDVVS